MAANDTRQRIGFFGDCWRDGWFRYRLFVQAAQALSGEFDEAQGFVGWRGFRCFGNREFPGYFLSGFPQLLQPLRGLLDETHFGTLG
jgi:hypothetical protein